MKHLLIAAARNGSAEYALECHYALCGARFSRKLNDVLAELPAFMAELERLTDCPGPSAMDNLRPCQDLGDHKFTFVDESTVACQLCTYTCRMEQRNGAFAIHDSTVDTFLEAEGI